MLRKAQTVITGGLGNQLFQIARGLYSSKDDSTSIDLSLGIPRLNPDGDPEICSYLSDSIFIDSNMRKDHVGNRIFNFALRVGVDSVKGRYRSAFIPCVELFCLMAFFLLRGKLRRFYISRGIGFDSRQIYGAVLPVGYFQSYRWLENDDVLEKLRKLSVKKVGNDLQELQRLAPSAKPLIVHCRFGDYKSESNFGIPDISYYENALNYMFANFSFTDIWVFSDEIELAKEKIPEKYREHVRWIENVDNSSAASLDAMRLGYGYVIANSTFSWWGAMLSANAEAPVVAPKKWFRNAPDPVDLIPDSWIRFDPW
jgi:hypothetical protein